ncbi:MAG: YggU family protein [Bdellovibrionaceae bacterium]|nr:YggU family protein [Pseudobdellovibrionaceae bacterium]MBX3032719.1 YggU family protein [Pseudobdellovibrionaceae bacterium]
MRLLIQPKASRNEIIGPHNGALKIRIQAPPIDGRANEELIEFLADVLGLAKRQLSLVRGDGARQKTVDISGLGLDEAKKLLGIKD